MEEMDKIEAHKALLSWAQENMDLYSEPLYAAQSIINLLADKVELMMERNPDKLFSTLYRLDIFESKLKQVFENESDVALQIATLIYERQIEKIISRQKYKTKPPEEDLAW